jgi:hypothetical protein
MTNTISRVQSILTPIWQEVSSLWSGAEFAFFDQSLYMNEDDASSAAFRPAIGMNAQSAGETVQLGGCCC